MGEGRPVDGEVVRRWDRAHVFHSWAAQALADAMPVASGLGSYFFDFDGNRYLDFSSQHVHVNLGHAHPGVLAALRDHLDVFTPIGASFAVEARSRAAHELSRLAPEGLNQVFFTNGGADANEHAIRMARLHTGRHKVLSAYRSYHGGTEAALALTGDPRRWPSESAGGAPSGHVHFWGPYLYRSAFHADTEQHESDRALTHLRELLAVEGPQSVAAIVLEPVVGTNGVLVPPPGYLAGVRQLCDEFGIVMVADEVMSGFGRCGEWFAVDRWHVAPDLITFAKGVTSGYVPLGGVIISDAVAASFQTRAYPGGLTSSGHPLACTAAVATIAAIEAGGVLDNARALGRDVIGPALRSMTERHPSVGEVRGLGAFWALELVRDQDTREPLVPFNATGAAAAPMAELAAACLARGVYPFIHFNRLHIAPPCTATPAEVRDGLHRIDDALTIADRHYRPSSTAK